LTKRRVPGELSFNRKREGGKGRPKPSLAGGKDDGEKRSLQTKRGRGKEQNQRVWDEAPWRNCRMLLRLIIQYR